MLTLYKRILLLLGIPIILREYFSLETGREYGIGLFTKMRLLMKMIRNHFRIPTASGFPEHLLIAIAIFTTQKSLKGDIVECGTWKGGSAANLSLVAALVKRRLEIFDSFQGLPEVKSSDKKHPILFTKEMHTYEKGSWKGTLEEVKRNVSRYGNISVCNFHKGYFEETLPVFEKKAILVFTDADLIESTKVCIVYLWPLLQNGCPFYIHEAQHLAVAGLFFDKEWWNARFHSNPPGLIGAGNGIGLYPHQGGFKSAIGYTIKNPPLSTFREIPQDA